MSKKERFNMENSHQDRYLMLDPNTAKARIFVRNIPTNNMAKRELEEIFEKYGKVMGATLNKGFGFVQFEEESSALDAINGENGCMFRDKPLEVSHARMPVDKSGQGAQRGGRGGGGRNRDMEGSINREAYRERSPLRREAEEPDWREGRYDNYHSNERKYEREGTGSYRGRGGGGMGRGRNLESRDMYRDEDYEAPRREYAEPRGNPVSTSASDHERTNDCEIIVHNKSQREYAEVIESKLKQMGMSVDLLFPNEAIPLARVLANISSRGTLYAISVTPQNEDRRSLTLNILHSSPEEHRNMPLESAISLIGRNFEAFFAAGGRRIGSKIIEARPTAVTASLATPGVIAGIMSRHPEPVQVMVNLLAQNRQLTVLQYDTLIRYLNQRREQQYRLELGDTKLTADLKDSLDSANPQATQLQNRILNILNSSSGGGAGGGQPSPPTPLPVPAPSSWPPQTSLSATPTPLLNDPTVQKALDSLLIQGDLLKKINSVSSNIQGRQGDARRF